MTKRKTFIFITYSCNLKLNDAGEFRAELILWFSDYRIDSVDDIKDSL